jgi:PAS domain S-box-containing protein
MHTDLALAPSVNADVAGILDAIDVPIVVVGLDCTLARFNPAAAEALGLVRSDLGRHFSGIRGLTEVKGLHLHKVCEEAIADGEPFRGDIQFGDRWFLLRVARYVGPGNQIRGAILTFTNVTAFRASLGQAIYEREYTKTILNTVIEPLVVLDESLRVQTANRAFYTFFGVSREQAQGVALCELGSPEWKGAGWWASLKATVSGNQEFATVEFERDFPGVGRRTVLLDARRLSRDRGALVLLAFHDITERKRGEEALREARDYLANQAAELEKLVAERTAALRETVQELQAFSYSIAHDMRAPLRSMRGFSQILLEQLAGKIDSGAEDFLQRIDRSSHRLDQLIQDVLNYSKILHAPIVNGPVDLDRLTRDILDTYPECHPTRADIRMEGTLPSVLGNEAFLTQCISNLLTNAVKFVSRGTFPRVKVWAQANESHARIFVQDNGIGIQAKDYDRIFRMFERINSFAEFDGTGIGLTIARKAVERMSGEIGFESEPGKGSTFWIQLEKA